MISESREKCEKFRDQIGGGMTMIRMVGLSPAGLALAVLAGAGSACIVARRHLAADVGHFWVKGLQG